MSRPDQGGASYRAVLALPHARGLLAAAIVPRLCYGLMGIPLLLTLKEGTGSYATAGAAASVFGLGVAVLGPVRARLVERHRPALMFLAVAFALSLAAIALAGAAAAGYGARLPVVAVLGLAALAGLFPPPVGPLTRTLLGRIAPDQAHLRRGLSLDTVAESTIFGAGPALAGVLVAASGAPLVLGCCAVLAIAGCALLARAAGRVPEPEPRAGAAAEAGPAKTASIGSASGRRFPGLPPLLLVTWAIAAAVAVVEIAVIAAWGALTAGVLMALFPVGGVVAGLAYGSRDWPGQLAWRPLALAALTAACYALPALALLPATAAVALLLAGGCADILVVTTYQLVSAGIPEHARTEASAWLNTAYNLGGAMGTAASGALVSHAGPHAAVAAATAACGLCAALGLLAARPPRRPRR